MIDTFLAETQGDGVAMALFCAFGGMSVIAAAGVTVSRNIVRTAVCLLFSLIGVAGLYFLLDAELLAAVQIVVYAGGTLILIVFGVMLTSKSPFSRFEPTRGQVVLALLVGCLLLSALVLAIVTTDFPNHPQSSDAMYPVALIGQVLLGDYLVPFELSSVLLLVVMIGAAYLAKRRRPNRAAASKSP